MPGANGFEDVCICGNSLNDNLGETGGKSSKNGANRLQKLEKEASKIPPIYQRSTASNISFEKGDKSNLLLNRDTDLFQEKEKCSRPPKKSSVSHGVRLRPSDSAGVETTETIPLLSPTMELDLLRNTWPTVDLFDNPNTPKISTGDEDNTVFSVWEENYQDLSGWCMDTCHGRCAFPIGEFETNKYSGMKSEDNGISIKRAAGKNGEISEVLLGDQECLEDSSLKVPEFPLVGAVARNETGDLELAIKSEIIDSRSRGVNDALLLVDPIDRRTDNWIQLENVQISNGTPIDAHHQTINHKRANSDVTVEFTTPVANNIAKNEDDNWDTINAFDNNESDTFDLLSYLCDDNTESPDGSVISRDSGPTINSPSSIASPVEEISSPTTRYPRRGEKREVSRRDYAEATSSSSSSIAAISAALDSVAKMSERTSRIREKRNTTSVSRSKKRCLDSDSEDRMSDGSYRESREKNNEASRKSRQNKKAKEHEMTIRANELEKDNRILKMKVDELDKLVTTMRTAILRSAMKRNS